MHCGNTDVPHDPGATCVHASSCHHYQVSDFNTEKAELIRGILKAIKGVDLAASTTAFFHSDGSVTYYRWGDREVVRRGLANSF